MRKTLLLGLALSNLGFAFAVVLSVSSTAFSAGALAPPEGPFLCTVEQATGFSFDKRSRSWKQTTFAPTNKYVLKRVKNHTLENAADITVAGGTHAVWGVWEFGFNLFGTAFCAEDVDDAGNLWCHGGNEIFNVNLIGRRFVRNYAGFYASDPSRFPDDKADPSFIEIGKCTAL